MSFFHAEGSFSNVFLAAAGDFTTMENSNDKMSVAQKEWPERGRILMPRISKANGEEKKPLAGAVALVTGGSRGIGRAIARQLAVLGACVSICGRDRAALEESVRTLREMGSRVYAQASDVTKLADVGDLVSKTEAALGPITILVNNAGIGLFGPSHEKTEADWDRVMATNLKSVFLLSRAVAPSMIRRGSGDIINISSLAGKSTFAGGGIYCASKWGVVGLSGCMAEDLREHGIRVSVICPGSVDTQFSTRGAKHASKLLRPEDVAHAVGAIVTQSPGSFLREIHLRPLRKP
jgi:NAD(P)-dependent dehydrogenase (short-subunit alcohol dehydrogenase family)